MELVPASESGVTFINSVKETPLRSISTYDYMYNGGGVAMADFNNDGLTDLFFTGNDVLNRIYLNEGNLVFRDVTEKAGVNGGKWYTGVTVVDINDDGWNDLYLSCSGPDFRTRSTANELYVNNQDGTFSERSHEFGIADNGLSTQSVFFDMDGDGDQDLFVLNHGWRNLANQESEWLERYRTLPAGEQKRYCNSLYRNDNGAYIQVTNSQVTADPGFGLGVAIADFNDDGRPDIYVCNDFFIPDRLFINYGQARFEEGLADFTGHCSFYSMGCDAADINNDGLTDLCVLDMTPADHVRNKVMMASMNVPLFEYMTETLNYLPQYMFNTLLLNRGYGLMSDIGQLAGVHQTDWSWAPLLSDFDNDGWKDLYVTNGFYRDVKNNDWRMKLNTMMLEENAGPEVIFEHLMSADQTPVPNVMYHNTNGLQFENVSVQWNMARPSFSNGAAYGDLDNDGDLDLAVNNLDEEAFIYRNLASDSGDRHYIQVSLKSTDPKYDPHDAVVNVYTGGQMQSAAFRFNRGYQSHMQERIHVGLGSQTEIDSVVVVWKRGISSVWQHPEPD
ncbi:MAG: CRTAC1 family protein, partial [Flavobacteriales bacterium]|nr:CRTAC1 family protein [Flavobacteriales bacterium]